MNVGRYLRGEDLHVGTSRITKPKELKMNAQYLHDACHDAMCQCPQFLGFDDDGYYTGYGEFGNIPKKGLYKTVQFWREYGYLLWEHGYENQLPDDVKEVFDNIDGVIKTAVNNYCKTL